MPTFFFFFFFFLLLTCALHPLSAIATTHNRRTLHQPYFPQDSFPPSPQPPAPKIPFSTTPPNDQPFFPSFPSPPPPPPSPPATSSFASVPANVSSLAFPQSPKSKPVSSKLIATAIVAVLAAAVILSAVVVLHIRKKKQQIGREEKTYRSDNSSRVASGDVSGVGGTGNGLPKMRRASQNSSEFLYLGTLVNSHSGIDSQVSSNHARDNGNNVNPRKLDSPELRPLPPLSGQQIYHKNYENSEVGVSREEDFEEFYSPRGSLGGRESSIGAGSASQRNFAAVAAENVESRRTLGSGSSSYSSSSSGSRSPARSVSLSISPPVSLSPISSRPKSPELVAIQTTPPPRAPPPPPPPPRLTTFSPSPPNLSSSERESISNSSSPEIYSRKSQESSPGLSIFYPRNSSHSPLAFTNSVSIPPPPPPPPPSLPPVAAKDREIPTTPTPVIRQQFLKPPVLITPSRPVPMHSATPLVSPMELPAVTEIDKKNEETPKPKLKPLHWDKVRASSDREMVWDQLKSSSFKLNEEMIETLFIVKAPNVNQNETNPKRPILPSPSQENRVLDPKKSQNIAISLRALNVTIEEVCEALLEGNAETLGTELLESLLKMAPTKEEERKLKEYKEDSPFKLGPAEKFLKALLDIPFAFKRIDAMLYISNFDSEVDYLKRAFVTLEEACEELRNNRMFLKLLEAVLKTGNRMNVGTNRGDAHAFKLDTLLKLVDVKGADGKTTLLHFVVQEIIRSEGARLSNTNENSTSTPTINDDAKCRKLGLQVVSGISSDLTNVKKAATMDSEVLNGDVLKLSKGISNILEVVRLNEGTGIKENSRKFSESMNKFMKIAEEEMIRIQAQESVALSLVKEITEYFHGNSAKEEAHPFRIFMVVRDFLTVLDRVCKEVGTINERTIVSTAHKFPVPVNPTLPPAFSAYGGRRQNSSSDDEGPPPL